MIQDVSSIEKWVESAEDEALEHASLMTVTSAMLEGHVIIDCRAAIDCVGERALAKNGQCVLARGDVREATTHTCRQDFRFGGPDQGAVAATYAVSPPCTLAGVKTQLSALRGARHDPALGQPTMAVPSHGCHQHGSSSSLPDTPELSTSYPADAPRLGAHHDVPR